MIVIQISDLNICERLYPVIEIATDKIRNIADRIQHDKIIIFTGNLFATRTYLSAADINFFNKLLDKFDSYKLLFTLGRFDYNIHAKEAHIAYKPLLEKRSLPFIERPGMHQFYDMKFAFLLKDNPEVAVDYVIAYNFIPDSTKSRGVLCNGLPRFIKGNMACAGPLVQNNPEDGADFGIIVWSGEKPHFMLLDQKWPSLKLQISDDQEAKLRLDMEVGKIIVQFINCTHEFTSNYVSFLRTQYKCPVDIYEEQIFQNDKTNIHDIQYQLGILNELYLDHPQKNYILNRYQNDIKPVSFDVPKWGLLYLTWDCLFAYKYNNHINFRELSLMTFIVGRNKSGKSSILDIITLALFNKPIRCGINNIINESSNSAYLKCGFYVESTKYSIERSFEKTSKQIVQKFAFRINHSDGSYRDIECRNVAEMYFKLQEILPVGYSQFCFNIVNQEEKSFLNFSAKGKKTLIHMLLGTEYINLVQQDVLSKRKEFHKQEVAMKDATGKKQTNRKMLDAEAEINRLEGVLRDSALQLVTFPGNLNHKSLFTLNLNSYISAIKHRQELILSGVKPITGLTNLEALKKASELELLFESALKAASSRLFEGFAKKAASIINKILLKISDFSITLEVNDEGFTFYIMDSQKKVNAASASGYQKFLLDLIARIVFLHLSKLTNFSMIIIDEGFGCLDEDNFIKVAKAISLLKKYMQIVIITHIEELKSYADKMIKVQDHKVNYGNLSESELARYALYEERKRGRFKNNSEV